MPIIPIADLKKDIHFSTDLCGQKCTFNTTWGLFSPFEIDLGTRWLMSKIEVGEADSILDIGCGYGPMGIALAKLAPKGHVDMIDRDFIAIEYANKNALLNNTKNATAFLSNGFDQIPATKKYDVIISNLPAKVNKEFFWILFAEAFEHLNPGGKFYVVTIAGLQGFIGKNFDKIFGNYQRLFVEKTYTGALAIKAK